MKEQIGYKFRWYPTEEQEEILVKTFGCVRYIYNWFLGLKSDYYKKFNKDIKYEEASKWFTLIRKLPEFSWLKEEAYVPLQQSLRHCDTAFKKFFKGLSEYPVFKKKNGEQKIEYTTSAFKFNPYNKELYITGLGNITDIRWSKNFSNRVSSITITKSRTNKYYITFTTTKKVKPLPKTGQTVGVDLGLKDLMILSDGTKIENPRFLKKALHRLKHLQREFSRKEKGSNRKKKARMKLAKAYEKVSNCRKDLAHKITRKLVEVFDIIKIEDLNVRGMIKNHKLALAISDVGWGMIRNFLEYKCRWYGKELQIIDRFFPSSKMCNVCSSINENLTLADREWNCQVCDTHHDRDINAAINIKNAERHSVNGRGGIVRLSGKRAESKQSHRSVKQLEPDVSQVIGLT